MYDCHFDGNIPQDTESYDSKTSVYIKIISIIVNQSERNGRVIQVFSHVDIINSFFLNNFEYK